MQQTKLRDKTFELLRNRPASIRLQDVADATGLPITWIKSFHLKGNKTSPSVNNVEKLYEHLSKKSLKV